MAEFLDPRGQSFQRWAATILERYQNVKLPPTDGAQWQAWAMELMLNPEVVGSPEPRLFPDWRSWASQFQQGLT